MRKFYLIALAAAALLISGCESEDSEPIPEAKRVAYIPDLELGVFVVTVEDFRYIVVKDGGGVAICPESR